MKREGVNNKWLFNFLNHYIMSSKQTLSYILIALIVVGAIFVIIRLVKLISGGDFWGLVIAAAVTFVLLIIYGKIRQK